MQKDIRYLLERNDIKRNGHCGYARWQSERYDVVSPREYGSFKESLKKRHK